MFIILQDHAQIYWEYLGWHSFHTSTRNFTLTFFWEKKTTGQYKKICIERLLFFLNVATLITRTLCHGPMKTEMRRRRKLGRSRPLPLLPESWNFVQKLWGLILFLTKMVFCYQNCSDLQWEKIILVIEKNFWNSRLKAENLQNFWDH